MGGLSENSYTDAKKKFFIRSCIMRVVDEFSDFFPILSREGCILHSIPLKSNWLYSREGVKDVSGKVITGEEETGTLAS